MLRCYLMALKCSCLCLKSCFLFSCSTLWKSDIHFFIPPCMKMCGGARFSFEFVILSVAKNPDEWMLQFFIWFSLTVIMILFIVRPYIVYLLDPIYSYLVCGESISFNLCVCVCVSVCVSVCVCFQWCLSDNRSPLLINLWSWNMVGW